MQAFMKKITDWVLEKEEKMAKSCAIPMKELEYQIDKVEAQKQKVQKEYDDAMSVLNEVSQKLEKIKNIETLRCSNV